MNEILKIDQLISSDLATTPESGDIVYNKLKEMIGPVEAIDGITSNKTITLDFSQISNITSAFLNNALGKLFREYEDDTLISLLRFSGVKTEDDFNIIKLAINNAIIMSKYNK